MLKKKTTMNFNKIFTSKNVLLFTALLLLLTIIINVYTVKKASSINHDLTEIEYTDSNMIQHKVYYDATFKKLQKENKELYDSLKSCKDQISYLVQFNYKKDYSTGKVYIHDTIKEISYEVLENNDTVKTFEYKSDSKDTISYNLKIGSAKKPNWYSLDVSVNEKFTIVNKSDGNGLNHVTIGSQNQGTISNVTTFKKKESGGLKKHLKIGPAVTAGYDVINKNFGVMGGVSVVWTF